MKKSPTAVSISAACLEKLHAMGVGAAWSGESSVVVGAHTDGMLLLEAGRGQNAEYAVVIRTRITEAQLELIVHQFDRLKDAGRRAMLFVGDLSLATAEALRQRGIQFVDTAGNMHLDLPWLKLCIIAHKIMPPRQGNKSLVTVSALKIMYVLLSRPKAMSWTQRELSTAAGVALGSVGSVLRALRTRGFMRVYESYGVKTRNIANTEHLFQHWIAGYKEVLRRKLLLGTYIMPGNRSITELAAMIGGQISQGVHLGGELGATLLHPGVLYPASATLHLDNGIAEGELVRRLKLVPDEKGNVNLMRAFGECTAMQGVPATAGALAEPLLLYAELVQVEDPRTREFARVFLSTHIQDRYLG